MTWEANETRNPYEIMFPTKGSYIEGGDGVNKLYEGYFLVSPA